MEFLGLSNSWKGGDIQVKEELSNTRVRKLFNSAQRGDYGNSDMIACMYQYIRIWIRFLG